MASFTCTQCGKEVRYDDDGVTNAHAMLEAETNGIDLSNEAVVPVCTPCFKAYCALFPEEYALLSKDKQ